MGEFTLSALLGQFDKAQSFESIGSWDHFTSQTSFFIGQSDVHSSPGGGQLDVFSSSLIDTALIYNYAEDNDVFERWFPDITTHQLVAYGWNRIDKATNSGQILFLLGTSANEFIPIPFTVDLERQRIEIIVTSADAINVAYRRTSLGINSFSLHIDDVLTQIDPITIHPTFDFREQQDLIKNNNITLGAIQHTYSWDKHFNYTVPLHLISDSHANLINWWWENQFNLTFTLDTSDSESVFICRITNDRQPINRRIRPDFNLWEGVIFLESLDKGSLVF